jgi:hypothetical protein
VWSDDYETYEDGWAEAAPVPAGGSAAAAQLLRLLTRPELIEALQAMALGTVGRRQVQVGQTPVPPAAFGNLLGSLTSRAVAEHHTIVAGNDAGTPQYLLGADGEVAVDVSDPDARADRLLEVLADSEPVWSTAEDSIEDTDEDTDETWDELYLLEAAEYGDD